jgi:hypothetical protein
LTVSAEEKQQGKEGDLDAVVVDVTRVPRKLLQYLVCVLLRDQQTHGLDDLARVLDELLAIRAELHTAWPEVSGDSSRLGENKRTARTSTGSLASK